MQQRIFSIFYEFDDFRFTYDIAMSVERGDFQQLKSEVKGKRRSILFYLSRSRRKRFIGKLTPALVHASYYGESDMLEYLLHQGAEVDGQSNNGKTALHRCCNPEDQDLLLRRGASPLLTDTKGNAALYHTHANEERRGQTIVEFEFNQAQAGRSFDPTMPLKVLQSQRNDRVPRGGRGSYLKSWESSIAVPQLQEADDVTADCVRIQPDLSEFQNLLASALLDTLADSPVEQMRFLIMGYLAPIDLLNGWDALIR